MPRRPACSTCPSVLSATGRKAVREKRRGLLPSVVPVVIIVRALLLFLTTRRRAVSSASFCFALYTFCPGGGTTRPARLELRGETLPRVAVFCLVSEEAGEESALRGARAREKAAQKGFVWPLLCFFSSFSTSARRVAQEASRVQRVTCFVGEREHLREAGLSVVVECHGSNLAVSSCGAFSSSPLGLLIARGFCCSLLSASLAVVHFLDLRGN